jgi:hypothetical protein
VSSKFGRRLTRKASLLLSGDRAIVLQCFASQEKAGGAAFEQEAGMLIGKRGQATTAIASAASERVTVRGRDLAQDLMGRATFT